MKNDPRIVMRSVRELMPYDKNARTHSEDQIQQVARSIEEFGFTNPVLVDAAGMIVAGHARVKAAQSLGLEQVPTICLEHLTPAQVRAYVIADNAIALNAGWDEELLRQELAALEGMDFDLTLTGFDDAEIDRLLADVDSTGAPGLTDEDAVPEPCADATTQPGDLWILGDHRLLCGDSSSAADVDRLVVDGTVHLVNMDPPYNVKVEPRSNNAIAAGLSSFAPVAQTHHQALDLARHPEKAKGTTRRMRPKDRPLKNDFVSDDTFDGMLRAWFGNASRVLEAGRGFYIWGGYANCANYPPALKESGLYFSQAIIWVKEHPVLTRKDFMGNHEWCQPAGTMVDVPGGRVAIETLQDDDRVVTYSRHHHNMIGLRHGIPVKTTSRQFDGNLLAVTVDGRTTWCTPGHLWSVRLAPAAKDAWCVYLMRRGTWWRVGKSKLLSSAGFGVRHRLNTEDGDEAWILSVHASNVEATLHEQYVLAEYGIPTTTWAESHTSRRTLAEVERLYDRLDSFKLCDNAWRAIADHGRDREHPFLRASGTRHPFGMQARMLARACNLLPGVMLVPVPREGQQVSWEPVSAVRGEAFGGTVYSMDVARFGHYVADGIVTHNCFYGWKEGAAHVYLGPNNATDTWSVKKVNPQAMVHLTEKPVELARRAIEYSSRRGERVLDLFGGSGSTLIAAEQTGRHAFLMELDPLYTDVIVKRWQAFTGQQATLDGGGTFDEVAAARSTGDDAGDRTEG